MKKTFNVTGICTPERNYMVDMSSRIEEIFTKYIREGKYFTINRARQYGKTTLLYMLEKRLKEQYIVLSLSFEAADELFVSLYTLTAGMIRKINRLLKNQKVSAEILEKWNRPVSKEFPLDDFGERITELCEECGKEVVLMIDEVDKNSDNQIFLSFLGLLRSKYLDQMKGRDKTFKSVILSGVYDIKNLKLRIHPEQESKYNSPWNIAADFDIDMSFSVEDIGKMLKEYENDRHTGMNIKAISSLIYDYTSGYPYLVSRIGQMLDEKVAGTPEFPDEKAAWTRDGVVTAEKILRKEPSTLFDDMVKKMQDFPMLKKMLQDILFNGSSFLFDRENKLINIGLTFGFLKDKNGVVAIGNRIFETRMYDLFLSEMNTDSEIYKVGSMESNQYTVNGMLQMDKVIEKFVEHFTEIYKESDWKFIENQGRKLFLLYLKPIINGTGNYYIEAHTRDLKRTDIIVDYLGRRYIIELKIWHGEEYNRRGEKQLFEYLDFYKEEKGYMISFNFNKKKKVGTKEIVFNGKTIMEAVV